MRRVPDFDDLVGRDLPDDERQRLRRAHELLVQAGPPPELSPELDEVPWPDEALGPVWERKRAPKPFFRRPIVLAAALATALVGGFLLGQSANSSSTSIDAQRVVKLHGTSLDSDALATLELGKADRDGNWPMVLHVTGLQKLAEGGYYDLYLTKGGKPLVLCGTFNVKRGEAVVRFTAAYDLEHFDKNGWVVTRQPPGHHDPTQIVLRPSV
jgi:hypothetical protein